MKILPKPDLVLLHPPSVYDFRKELIIPSPIADLIPSGQHFDMYPIGFSFLGEYLERHGINVRIINLAARMLENPGFDVERCIARLRPGAFGIGLHWLPHCHGAVEIARLCKKLHPEVPVILGGYSATIFHRELMDYPEIDFIVRGDTTEEPLLRLMRTISGGGNFEDIPNLTYRAKRGGDPVENPMEYVPEDLVHLGDNYRYMIRAAVKYRDVRGPRAFSRWWTYPLTAVMTCRGCDRDCAFCGGSASAMANCFARKRAAFRSPENIVADVDTISRFTGAPIFVIGDLRQGGQEFAESVLRGIAGLAPANTIVFELFGPAPRDFFEKASRVGNFALEISPESHDEKIRNATGKAYTNEALERNLSWALELGCKKFDVFFMIGLPGQTAQSVDDTVSYCDSLIERFGDRVNPLIGPLAPFLDPGSPANSHPEMYGYRVIFKTLDDYRTALLSPHWRDSLGYETNWMNRQDIVDATYGALEKLNRIKVRRGLISPDLGERIERFLSENVELLKRVDAMAGLSGDSDRESEARAIKIEAERLLSRDNPAKEEIRWPVVGGRFKYLGIARILAKRDRAPAVDVSSSS